jgi:hypothetical protein
MYNQLFHIDFVIYPQAATLSINGTVIGNIYQINAPKIATNNKIDVLHKNFYR